MLPRFKLPLLALAGVLFALFFVLKSNKAVPVAAPVAEPSQTRFATYLAGSGLIEAQSENVSIGTPLSGIVTQVAVEVGSRVKQGALLFELENADVQAELAIKQAAVNEAQAAWQDARNQLARVEQMGDKRAVSAEELDRRRNAQNGAKARLDAALAQVRATETHLDRLRVRAPMDGVVLQLNVRAGEFAPAGALAKPLLLLGNLDKLHVRVDIDENDAWRFKPDAAAEGFLRGNRELKAELKFVRVEPYVVPKKSLTGDASERVDTRVLQAVYRFDRTQLPAYVGQQMDVFIEVAEAKKAQAVVSPKPEVKP